jgi:hypothetical protein
MSGELLLMRMPPFGTQSLAKGKSSGQVPVKADNFRRRQMSQEAMKTRATKQAQLLAMANTRMGSGPTRKVKSEIKVEIMIEIKMKIQTSATKDSQLLAMVNTRTRMGSGPARKVKI